MGGSFRALRGGAFEERLAGDPTKLLIHWHRPWAGGQGGLGSGAIDGHAAHGADRSGKSINKWNGQGGLVCGFGKQIHEAGLMRAGIGEGRKPFPVLGRFDQEIDGIHDQGKSQHLEDRHGCLAWFPSIHRNGRATKQLVTRPCGAKVIGDLVTASKDGRRTGRPVSDHNIASSTIITPGGDPPQRALPAPRFNFVSGRLTPSDGD